PSDISTLYLHDALPIWKRVRDEDVAGVRIALFRGAVAQAAAGGDDDVLLAPHFVGAGSGVSTRLQLGLPEPFAARLVQGAKLPRSEEHTSELQSRFDLV